MQNISFMKIMTAERSCAFIQISFRSARLNEEKSHGHTVPVLLRITLIARASHGSNRLCMLLEPSVLAQTLWMLIRGKFHKLEKSISNIWTMPKKVPFCFTNICAEIWQHNLVPNEYKLFQKCANCSKCAKNALGIFSLKSGYKKAGETLVSGKRERKRVEHSVKASRLR